VSTGDGLGAWGRAARDLFGTDVPVVLGPMAGGPSTPALASAVSNAGGLGSLGGGYLSPAQLRTDVRAVAAATDRPFAVNLFAPEQPAVDPGAVARAVAVLAPYRAELGMPPQEVPAVFAEPFEDQLDVVVSERVPIVTFTFGMLPEGAMVALHDAGAIVGGTATTVAEARSLEGAGVDFVCAQGAEAGGHRGSFLGSGTDDLIGLVSLVPQVCDAVDVPVVAAGGIGDGRGIAAALVLGACAAQLGTAFLLCDEAGTSAPYRAAVEHARPEDTTITTAFSGRRARGIANRLARDLAGRTDLPPYPVLNALTRDLRRRAAEAGDASLLSLWCGQGVGLVGPAPAAVLVGELVDRARAALAGPAPVVSPGRAGG